ncbi:MAG TPA: hypothetical protein VL916_14275 [Ilumatobacteraceae bacterium]|nr:hypothetical protein [Ilumatobacteraceae bacterium]
MNAITGADRHQILAGVAVLGGVVAAVGTTMTWFTIEIGGIAAPGGSATGMEGRDGWTVLAAAVASFVAAGLLLLRRNPMAAKVMLLVAGGVTTIVAVAGVIDASGKDHEVEEAFGIPADRVSASVGAGLWFVALGGVAELTAGAISRHGADETAAPATASDSALSAPG